MMNMDDQDLDFELPIIPGRNWYRTIDTAALSPNDFADPGTGAPVPGENMRVRARSIVVLVSR
jgi:isoamylase